MTTLTSSQACKKLNGLIEQAAKLHKPVQIKGSRKNAVVVSEEDCRSIEETIHLLSIPRMRESIIKGGRESLSKCARKPGWLVGKFVIHPSRSCLVHHVLKNIKTAKIIKLYSHLK